MRKRHVTIIIIFISVTEWWIASKFCKMKCETAFKLKKKFDWSAKKYLFTMIENRGQFLHSIGNSVFNRFLNFFYHVNFL